MTYFDTPFLLMNFSVWYLNAGLGDCLLAPLPTLAQVYNWVILLPSDRQICIFCCSTVRVVNGLKPTIHPTQPFTDESDPIPCRM